MAAPEAPHAAGSGAAFDATISVVPPTSIPVAARVELGDWVMEGESLQAIETIALDKLDQAQRRLEAAQRDVTHWQTVLDGLESAR